MIEKINNEDIPTSMKMPTDSKLSEKSLQKRFDDIIDKAKSDQMHNLREKSFK